MNSIPVKALKLPSEKSLSLFIRLFEDNKSYLIKDYLDRHNQFNFNIVIGMLLSCVCVPDVKISLDLILDNLFELNYQKNLRLTHNSRIELEDFVIKYTDYLTKMLTSNMLEELFIVNENKFIKYNKTKTYNNHFIIWISFYMTFIALYQQASNKLLSIIQQINPQDLQVLMLRTNELNTFITASQFQEEEINNYLDKFLNLLIVAFKIKQSIIS